MKHGPLVAVLTIACVARAFIPRHGRDAPSSSKGRPAVETIEATPRTGETPNSRVELKTVRIEKK